MVSLPPGADNVVVDARSGTSTTWRDLPVVEPPATTSDSPTAVVASSYDALPAVWHHATSGGELLVVAPPRLEATLRSELDEAGFTVLEGAHATPSSHPRDVEDGRLWLLTSGSTGRPKRIGHTLATLTTVSGELPPRRWLCPYSPGTYAWWQVVTLGLNSPGQDLVVVDPADLDGWTAAAVEHGVTAASGTPTFWRQTVLAHRDQLALVPLQQISLGGEPVDQAILDQLRALFPHARISWIYASSEVGASIVVHDGRAGFPVEWLGRRVPGRPTIEVEDGQLVITSPHHGEGQAGRVRTGDAVQEVDGRVLITGRVDRDEINVGGAKVSAGVVRSVLTAHESVAWAAVRGRRAPVVGQMVVADVVLVPGADAAEASAALPRWSRERLPEYAVPRRIKVLDAIPAKETLKSDV